MLLFYVLMAEIVEEIVFQVFFFKQTQVQQIKV